MPLSSLVNNGCIYVYLCYRIAQKLSQAWDPTARAGADRDPEVTAGKDCSHPYCTRDNCSVGRLHPTERQSPLGPVEILVQGTGQKSWNCHFCV